MAAAFRPVNPPVSGEEDREPMETESTVPPARHPEAATQQQATVVDDPTTPTRATFNSALANQKPLPTTPFPGTVHIVEPVEDKIQRGNSQRSRTSTQSGDVDMEESEGPADAADEGPASDDESLNTDGSKPTKKKKSQRFYCTDYPPCTLSFTRSEHLARHIRKHTGERPFQCHCSRRFSRLDNLRQHAQTVHVNEDIPIDSLAATGARFQRQAMRTDRARQVGGRARASTASSVGGIARGHAKSLSTSSISSLNSNISSRDRPPPLVMADPRSKGPMETYGSRDSVYHYRPASPSDFSTPTSATFSTGQNSPRWGSGFASPTSSHSRAHSLYTESRTPGRRLSGPSGNNPFQSPYGANVGRPSFSPGTLNASNPGAFAPTPMGLAPSPSTAGSALSHRDSVANAQDEVWRRRTWHPDSQNFYNARLTNIAAPAQYQPIPTPPLATPASQAPTIRLPGIESFDSAPGRPLSPPKRIPSPMAIDTDTTTHPLLPGVSSGRDGRHSVSQWDMSLHRGLTRLEITSNSSQPRDSAGTWASEANQAVQAQAEQVRLNHPTVRFEAGTTPLSNESTPTGPRSLHQHTMSAPSISTPREFKRHGWYQGPMASQGIAQSSRGNRIDRIVHPNLANGFQAFPPRDAAPARNQPEPQRDNNTSQPMRALDALVAVATSEGSTATAC